MYIILAAERPALPRFILFFIVIVVHSLCFLPALPNFSARRCPWNFKYFQKIFVHGADRGKEMGSS